MILYLVKCPYPKKFFSDASWILTYLLVDIPFFSVFKRTTRLSKIARPESTYWNVPAFSYEAQHPSLSWLIGSRLSPHLELQQVFLFCLYLKSSDILPTIMFSFSLCHPAPPPLLPRLPEIFPWLIIPSFCVLLASDWSSFVAPNMRPPLSVPLIPLTSLSTKKPKQV